MDQVFSFKAHHGPAKRKKKTEKERERIPNKQRPLPCSPPAGSCSIQLRTCKEHILIGIHEHGLETPRGLSFAGFSCRCKIQWGPLYVRPGTN